MAVILPQGNAPPGAAPTQSSGSAQEEFAAVQEKIVAALGEAAAKKSGKDPAAYTKGDRMQALQLLQIDLGHTSASMRPGE